MTKHGQKIIAGLTEAIALTRETNETIDAAELARRYDALLAERDRLQAEVERLDAEVERCHERLEMTHRYRCVNPETGETARVDIPRAERSFAYDGIDCRDETIRLQDRAVDELRAEVERLRGAGDAVLGSFGPDDERWFSDEMRDALNKLALLVLPEDEDAARSLLASGDAR